MNFSHYSRYINTDQIQFKDDKSTNTINTVGLYLIPDSISKLKPHELLSVKIGPELAGRPDLISEQQYGTPYYAWIVVMVNRPLNPINWPKNGDRILVPTQLTIDSILDGDKYGR
jgi:hypothetical protein